MKVPLAALAVTLAIAPAAADACLVCTPSTPAPVVSGRQQPAPPAITTNFVSSTTYGWVLAIGQQIPRTDVCGQPAHVFARITAGFGGPWAYRFVRGNGSATDLVQIPAAPTVNGKWVPSPGPFGKEVEDVDGPAQPGVSDMLVVTLPDGRTISSVRLPMQCNG